MSVESRVKQFPGEHLVVSAGKLFCHACREELTTKMSVLKSHLRSKKHVVGKEKLAERDKRERDIAAALKKHDECHHPKGEILPESVRVFRVKVVTAFLKAGIPLNKIEHFRSILEETAFRLTDRRHLADLIPFILSRKKSDQEGNIWRTDFSYF